MMAVAFPFLLSAATLCGGIAEAARSDWSSTDYAQMRLLLLAPARPELPFQGGIELVLEPGWHTYWRVPGDVGVPPRFDFSRSTNVRSVQVSYPAPERRRDESGLSLIYPDEVVLPIEVVPQDASQPVELDLVASFGVCRDICIPATAEARLESERLQMADPLARARLDAYLPRVPSSPKPGVLEFLPFRIEGRRLVISVRMPDVSDADLFADPPEGWLIGQPELLSRSDGVSIYVLELPKRADGPVMDAGSIRFVAIAGGRSVESQPPLHDKFDLNP